MKTRLRVDLDRLELARRRFMSEVRWRFNLYLKCDVSGWDYSDDRPTLVLVLTCNRWRWHRGEHAWR